MTKTKWILVLLVILGLIGYLYRSKMVPSVVLVDKEENTPQVNIWLEKLAKEENCPIVDGIVDKNNLVSKGKFCFQESTYLYFVKKYKVYPYAEDYELLSNWGDSQTQEIIIRKMMEEDKSLLARHWVLSVKKLGLPPKKM